jgi:hypothetical protein
MYYAYVSQGKRKAVKVIRLDKKKTKMVKIPKQKTMKICPVLK